MTATLHDEEMGLPDKHAECEPLLAKHEEVLDGDGEDVVQFSAADYFADETDHLLKIDIVRLGTIRGRVAVNCCTEDGSAMSGQQYGAVDLQVVLEEGQRSKAVKIPILQDGSWSATREFTVQLSSPRNCILGEHLNGCRVKVINKDPFPSGIFDVETGSGAEGTDERDWLLFREYCKLNLHSSGRQWQTLIVLLLDQLTSICIFGSLWVGVYIVNTVFERGGSSRDRLIMPDRYQTIVVVSLWYVLPIVALYTGAAVKNWIDVKGASRMFLQKSLMQTCMYYTPESRSKVTVADMNAAIGVSAQEVATGYAAALNIVGILGRILAIELFIFFFQHDRLAVCSVAITVLVIVLLLPIRVRVAREAKKEEEDRWLLMETLVEEAHTKHRLVADYSKKGFMSDMFAMSVEEYTLKRIPNALVHLNTQYATRLLSGICIANYIVQRGPAVLSGNCSLGIFLATITVFSVYLNDALIALNDQLMLIVDAFIPLRDFVEYLNLPLELSAQKEVNLRRRQQTYAKSVRKAAEALPLNPPPTSRSAMTDQKDYMDIVLNDLTFRYSDEKGTILEKISLSLPQGKLFAVTGPHSSGKSTFVQLLASNLLPSGGDVFVPSHLQVLHVTREPMFLHASILDNLIMGLPAGITPDMHRVKKVLMCLGLPVALDMVEQELASKKGVLDSGLARNSARTFAEDELKFMESAEPSWELSFSHSQKVKLHVARALIADPEVMVLDRTLQSLNEETALDILNILRSHVMDKGFLQPEHSKASRRPRTVFFSTGVGLDKADCLLEVDPVKKSVHMTHQQPTPSLGLLRGVGQMCSPRQSPR